MWKFEQTIDGFQVLNAATKWIHNHTKTRRKNKLKVANGNERLWGEMFRSCSKRRDKRPTSSAAMFSFAQN